MQYLKDKRKKDWFFIENELVDRDDLTLYEKIIYVVLVRHSNEDSSCFPSYKTISEKAGCSERKAKDVIKCLIDKKLITKETRKKKNKNENDSNLYFVMSAKNNNKGCAPDAQGCAPDAQGCAPDAQQVVHDMHTNNTNINNTNINIYSRIISRLNERANKIYKYTTKKTQSLINSRFSEGFTEEDFYQVIENKVSAWKGTDREMYLRPETLFGNKFEGYLNEKPRIKKNKTSVKEDKEFYPEIQFENLEE